MDFSNVIKIKISGGEVSTIEIDDDEIWARSDNDDDDDDDDDESYSIGLLSDIHIQYDSDQDGNGNTDWKDACDWYQSLGVDAICIAGDLTKNGYDTELEEWKTARDNSRGTVPVYSCSGNHESIKDTSYMVTNSSSMRPYLDTDATNDTKTYFYKTINNDIYVFMPCYIDAKATSSNVMFSSESLAWLENVLETYRNQRVFLFQHIPPSPGVVNGNFGTANGAYTLNLWGTNKADRQSFMSLMAHYKNVIWFSGHSHIKWEEESDYPGLNYMRWNSDGARMVHLSSTTVPRDITALESNTYLYAEGEAAVMDVYENKVVIKGYDLITSQYISEFNLELDTTPVTIPAKENQTEPETPVVTLSSISATKTTTSYDVGGVVSTSDITVTATYSDGTTETVTGWSASSVDTSSAGTKTMTITYQGKTTSISITVNAVVVPSEPEEPSHEDVNIPITWSTGNLSYTTGQVASSSEYAYSNDISHTSGATYTITANAKYSSYPKIRVVEFDSNRNVLGYTAEILSASTNLTCEYTPTNDNAAFVVLRMNSKSYTSNLTADGVITLVKHT